MSAEIESGEFGRKLAVESAVETGYRFDVHDQRRRWALSPSLAMFSTKKNRVAVADSAPNDGEAPVIVGLADAAMHMYAAAIDALPDAGDPEFGDRAGVILAGLRKLQGSLSDAAGRSRVTPSVIVALSGVRSRYDDLMATAANGPGATLGQRLYIARGRAKLSTKEAANGVGLRKDLIEAVEAEEPVLEDEASRIKDLIAALGG
jgi:hypothetical protein